MLRAQLAEEVSYLLPQFIRLFYALLTEPRVPMLTKLIPLFGVLMMVSPPILELDDGEAIVQSNAVRWYLGEGSEYLPAGSLDRDDRVGSRRQRRARHDSRRRSRQDGRRRHPAGRDGLGNLQPNRRRFAGRRS